MSKAVTLRINGEGSQRPKYRKAGFMGLFGGSKKTAKEWLLEAQRMQTEGRKEFEKSVLRMAETLQLESIDPGMAKSAMARIDRKIAGTLDKALQIDAQYAPALLAKAELALAGDAPRIDEAIACLERALEANPAMADAFYIMGVANEMREQPEEAFTCYDRATALNPADAWAWMRKSSLLAQGGKQDQADACAERAQALRQDFSNEQARWETIEA